MQIKWRVDRTLFADHLLLNGTQQSERIISSAIDK